MTSFGTGPSRACAPAPKKATPKPTGTAPKAKAMPSDILNRKTIDPFNTSKKKSGFAEIYSSGGIPCRIQHGSVKHKLTWSTPPERVPLNPILLNLAEGLQETIHPYYFVAREGFRELLSVPDANKQAIPLLSSLTPLLKAALISRDDGVFTASLSALVQLSCVVGPALNPHLKMIIPALAKRSMERKHRDSVTDAMQTIETNGGQEALMVIKSKVPTYCSVGNM